MSGWPGSKHEKRECQSDTPHTTFNSLLEPQALLQIDSMTWIEAVSPKLAAAHLG